MAALDEKRGSRDEHVDNVTEPDNNKGMFTEDDPNADYTGVAKKTDPEEIRLVRKLDYRIMVSFFCSPYDQDTRSMSSP